ncbi:MAG: hypothetical protein ACT4N5_00955 [Nitrosopumilaceae archaeon]
MIAVISVSKAYSHRGNHRHRPNTKKHWYVYYVDDEGRLGTKKVNFLEAMFYKSLKTHRYKYYCQECGSYFLAFLKSKKKSIECPNCS